MKNKLIKSVRDAFSLNRKAMKEVKESQIITKELFIELCHQFPNMTLGEFCKLMDDGKMLDFNYSSGK